jgi:hypothetical protein
MNNKRKELTKKPITRVSGRRNSKDRHATGRTRYMRRTRRTYV